MIYKFVKEFFHDYKIYKLVKKRFPTVTLEKSVIIKGNIENLRLGKNVIIQSGTVLHLGGMEWCQNTGYIEIGDDSVVSPNCTIYGCGPGGVHIGKRFDCGPGVVITASRTDYTSKSCHIFEPVHIGDDVIIYGNAVISLGVKIGNGTVIAACSVVIEDIPENVLAGGVPARIIKNL